MVRCYPAICRNFYFDKTANISKHLLESLLPRIHAKWRFSALIEILFDAEILLLNSWSQQFSTLWRGLLYQLTLNEFALVMVRYGET